MASLGWKGLRIAKLRHYGTILFRQTEKLNKQTFALPFASVFNHREMSGFQM
jgi:hypothetical protein